MIEALKDDTIINDLGGRFKFTALVQHRVRQLMEGDRPLVDRRGPDGRNRTDLEIAVAEIVERKITLELPEQAEQPEPVAASAADED